MPDNYASLVSNIVMKCGTDVTGVSWGNSGVPVSPHIIVSYGSGYTQYNVCGNLNISGSGSLVPSGQTSIIVVENGSVNVASKSNITASSTTFILTGSTSYSHQFSFPNGAGQLATLSIEPPTGSIPWKGISIYVDPRLTTNVDDDFGPGASLIFDGVAYMPYTNLTFHGNTNSGTLSCSELILDTFTSNGSGTLSFSQNNSNCGTLGIGTPSGARLVM